MNYQQTPIAAARLSVREVCCAGLAIGLVALFCGYYNREVTNIKGSSAETAITNAVSGQQVAIRRPPQAQCDGGAIQQAPSTEPSTRTVNVTPHKN
jgi:hypothetical protein